MRDTINVGFIISPKSRAPLRKTPNKGVKKVKAARRLTG
jgi:hypothetical protein